MDRPAFRRRHYFIKKDFQFRFIMKFCLLVLLGVTLSTGLLFLFSQDTLTSSFNQSRLVIESTAWAILPAVIYTNLITLGLISLATVGVTLFVSHKLAGPMYRLEADLKIIGEGDLTKRIRLRKKDQFKDLVESLNLTTAGLHEKVLALRVEVEKIIRLASEQREPEAVIEPLKALHERMGSDFKI